MNVSRMVPKKTHWRDLKELASENIDLYLPLDPDNIEISFTCLTYVKQKATSSLDVFESHDDHLEKRVHLKGAYIAKIGEIASNLSNVMEIITKFMDGDSSSKRKAFQLNVNVVKNEKSLAFFSYQKK